MLFKFEIGRKLAGSVEESPGFLKIGVTCANLNMVGKVPCEKDKFARLDIRTEKTPEQDLRSEVGMKSSGEDLAGIELRISKTSLGETGEGVSKVGPIWVRSGGGVESMGSLPMIVLWIESILALK